MTIAPSDSSAGQNEAGWTPPPAWTPPPGWYGDPYDARSLRWWSGAEWTAYTYPVQIQPVQPAKKARPPRKWIGRFGGWIFAASSVFIWLWLFGFSLLFNAIAPHAHDDGPAVLSPFLLVTGAATVAAAILYTMAYRLKPADGLSASRLVIIAGVGGLAATLVAAPINTAINLLGGGTSSHPSGAALVLAGVVEELVKVTAAILLALRLPVKNARIGLFIGGAVGLGFSVIENLSYLQEAFARGQDSPLGFGVFVGTAIGRELTGPFLHPVFTALLTAAVFGATRNGRYRVTFGVVLAYLGVAAAHGMFNGAAWLAQNLPWPAAARGGAILLFDLVFVVASGVTWLLIARRIRRRSDQEAAQQEADQRAATNASSAA
ncbi:PrsW family glutamic-type intramembrane protease [Leifsonia sp. NPDC014704]|uniref:PrsW family glutamic-type intramembrane protease n=1 Tax=Leifsonia sp. NPDC014704 TaxID=3364123 RepID=UPI0036F4848C